MALAMIPAGDRAEVKAMALALAMALAMALARTKKLRGDNRMINIQLLTRHESAQTKADNLEFVKLDVDVQQENDEAALEQGVEIIKAIALKLFDIAIKNKDIFVGTDDPTKHIYEKYKLTDNAKIVNYYDIDLYVTFSRNSTFS